MEAVQHAAARRLQVAPLQVAAQLPLLVQEQPQLLRDRTPAMGSACTAANVTRSIGSSTSTAPLQPSQNYVQYAQGHGA